MVSNMRFAAVSVYALVVCVSHSTAAQDLSRYRDVAFANSVASVVAATGTNAAAVKVIHQRPARIEEVVVEAAVHAGPSCGANRAADIENPETARIGLRVRQAPCATSGAGRVLSR